MFDPACRPDVATEVQRPHVRLLYLLAAAAARGSEHSFIGEWAHLRAQFLVVVILGATFNGYRRLIRWCQTYVSERN